MPGAPLRRTVLSWQHQDGKTQGIPLLCLSCSLGQSLGLATFLNRMGLMLSRNSQPRIASSWSMQKGQLRKELLPQGSRLHGAGCAQRAGGAAGSRTCPALPPSPGSSQDRSNPLPVLSLSLLVASNPIADSLETPSAPQVC